MKRLQLPIVTLFVLLALAAAFVLWAPQARSQINAAPNWVPIGAAANGSQSAVWFHETSTRRVLACTTAGSATAPAVHCATATLP